MLEPSAVDKLRQPSYTPARRELQALLELYLATDDEEQQRIIATGLRRAAVEAYASALLLLPKTQRPRRARLVALLGRLLALLVERSDFDARLATFLPLVFDEDSHAARQAIVALGKLPPQFAAAIEPLLLDRLLKASDAADRKALVEALGKLGGEGALAALRALPRFETPILSQTVERAILRIERSLTRPSAATEDSPSGGIRTDRALPHTYRLVLRCRAGLTAILVDELLDRGLIKSRASVIAVEPPELGRRDAGGQLGRVMLDWSRPLSALFSSRIWTNSAFTLPCSPSDPAAAVATALAEPRTRALFAALSVDAAPFRYRLHFAGGGHRRALIWQIAAAVRRDAPELLNDPKASPFQIEVHDRRRDAASELLLVPRLVDPRFAYHQKDVPAASHPPVAAALARLAEVGPDDVVWDPFTGSGTELVEVALNTPCRQIYGTDLDDDALAIARQNIAAAALPQKLITLQKADALRFVPLGSHPRPTRILTNPPMGRRTRPGELTPFLMDFLKHAASILAPRGRLVWISPQPRLTTPYATQLGLQLLSARPVDLHGFWGSLEVFEKR